VVDTEGRVLAHNRYAEYGKLYSDPTTRADLAASGFVQRPIRYEGQAALDMAVPLAPLQQELKMLGTQIILFSGGFFLIALGLFYLVGRGLARPLVALARQMEQVSEGSLTAFSTREGGGKRGGTDRSSGRPAA
jgi:hypothetical protein